MNPLNIPWGRKPKEPEVEPDPVPSFLGVRNEAVRDDVNAEKIITIKVQGIHGVPNGEYRIKWSQGAPLKEYLNRLKLKSVAIRSAVRDATNPEVGRIRMHYVPGAGAVITIGSPGMSSVMEIQRGRYSADQVMRLAANMGGGAKEVEVPLVGRRKR